MQDTWPLVGPLDMCFLWLSDCPFLSHVLGVLVLSIPHPQKNAFLSLCLFSVSVFSLLALIFSPSQIIPLFSSLG